MQGMPGNNFYPDTYKNRQRIINSKNDDTFGGDVEEYCMNNRIPNRDRSQKGGKGANNNNNNKTEKKSKKENNNNSSSKKNTPKILKRNEDQGVNNQNTNQMNPMQNLESMLKATLKIDKKEEQANEPTVLNEKEDNKKSKLQKTETSEKKEKKSKKPKKDKKDKKEKETSKPQIPKPQPEKIGNGLAAFNKLNANLVGQESPNKNSNLKGPNTPITLFNQSLKSTVANVPTAFSQLSALSPGKGKQVKDQAEAVTTPTTTNVQNQIESILRKKSDDQVIQNNLIAEEPSKMHDIFKQAKSQPLMEMANIANATQVQVEKNNPDQLSEAGTGNLVEKLFNTRVERHERRKLTSKSSNSTQSSDSSASSTKREKSLDSSKFNNYIPNSNFVRRSPINGSTEEKGFKNVRIIGGESEKRLALSEPNKVPTKINEMFDQVSKQEKLGEENQTGETRQASKGTKKFAPNFTKKK